ncbi:MAG: PilZ domain-containing protein [Ketobacteraceae bacterium]|nr:PilZ domain-containing protein [Ketobacteraceae bacterium]
MDTESTTNQRKVDRRHLIYYLRVFNKQDNELLGNLVDISTRGIMLVSDSPIPVNKRFQLKMVLPETISGSREVEFEAESRWCQNDANKDFYDTGFELIDPTNKFLEAVDKLVDDCLFKE